MEQTVSKPQKTLVEKPHFSFSSLSCFENCPYEYYLSYVLKDFDTYPKENNFYAESGTFVHETLDLIFSNLLSVEEAPMYFVDNYDNFVFYKAKQSTMDNTFLALGEYFTSLNLEPLKNYEILGTEKYVEIELFGELFVGFIDLLLRDKSDGKIIVVDHKSSEYPLTRRGKVKSASKQKYLNYIRQLCLYSEAVKKEYGEYPKILAWNYFKSGKIDSIPFLQSDSDEATVWFGDILDKIRTEKEYPAHENFFYCTQLCPYRHSCEYALTADWSEK